MNQLVSAKELTMSSREVASLTGKRHDNVMQVIRSLIADQILTPEIQESKFQHRGNAYSQFIMGKRDIFVVVARLSPEFTARVVDRWMELEEAEKSREITIQSRKSARLESPHLTAAIKDSREGKETKHFHYSNEFDMINRIVIGSTAKKYRQDHDLADTDAIRDYMTPGEIRCVEHFQRLNTSMIEIGLTFEERKVKLSEVYATKYQDELSREVLRLEA